jgi:hypothetical protein
MAIDPNTLDPEQIRHLPFDRSKPLNGLTEEQLRAIGGDPEFVENARNEQNAWEAARAIQQQAALVVATQEAVDDFELSPAEAAFGLAESGHSSAHDLFVEQWQKAEAEEAAAEAAWNASELDAASYVEQYNVRKALERAQLEQEADATKQQLEAARIEALKDHVDSFVGSTPGAYEIKAGIEQTIIERLKRTGLLPTTDGERKAVLDSALIEMQVVGTATEAMKSQVDQEWRILRKESRGRDGLVTVADIANAEQHYKQARFSQLAEANAIDAASLVPGPTAEEQSAALTEKYRANQERSTSFHQQVADIATRGRVSNGGTDRGERISEEKRRYKEALARAEATAAYGPIDSGYGPDA